MIELNGVVGLLTVIFQNVSFFCYGSGSEQEKKLFCEAINNKTRENMCLNMSHCSWEQSYNDVRVSPAVATHRLTLGFGYKKRAAVC